MWGHTLSVAKGGLLVALAVLLGLSACGGSVGLRTTNSDPSAGTKAAGLIPPKIVEAKQVRLRPSGPLRFDQTVGRDFTGIRVFVNSQDGFAIGAPRKLFGDIYPLATRNGGNVARGRAAAVHVGCTCGGGSGPGRDDHSSGLVRLLRP